MTGLNSPTLLVVIVNYRTADLTVDCLKSLEVEVASLGDVRVVVTDNASGDDSVARLGAAVREKGWEGWASIQPLERNGGFAYGNNAAIRPALVSVDAPRYVLLLNPDTVVHPGALKALVDHMEERPEIGIAGSRLEDPDGTPQQSAFRFHSILGELENGMGMGLTSKLLARWAVAPPVAPGPGRVDWVCGASLIVRREVFDSIGLLDEGFFMYYEETDFCLRAARAGWPCWYVPSSRVIHLVGQSSGVTDPRLSRKRRPAYWFASRRRYFRSNHGAAKTFLADLAWAAGFATFKAKRFLVRKPDSYPRALLRDFLRYNFLGAKA